MKKLLVGTFAVSAVLAIAYSHFLDHLELGKRG